MEDDPSSYKLKVNNYSADEEDKTIPIAVEDTFHEYLETQLGMVDLEDERAIKIAQQIIGSIDDDGYLRREPLAIIDDLVFSQNIITNEAEIEYLLKKIQRFDPPGIGSRDLRECLLLQIETKLEQKNEEFSDEILSFTIVNRDGELELTLNSRNAPDLRVNDQYRDMLKTYKDNKKGKRAVKKDKEAIVFIKQKIDSAKWFIDAIRQRQQTMYKTMYSIMQYQYDFFRTGDQKTLKPMILKDIADITGLDISTISRVANSKFVQTEYGTKRLKDFFSESLQTNNGEEVSTLEVKKILTDIIEEENKRKPFSDEKLKNILRDKGYNIARRTVAKYREQLNIPVARLRKEL